MCLTNRLFAFFASIMTGLACLVAVSVPVVSRDRRGEGPMVVDSCVQRIAALHSANTGSRTTGRRSWSELATAVDQCVSALQKPSDLKACFYRCHVLGSGHANDLKDDPCPYFVAESALLLRLGELDHADATGCLVEILTDESIPVDGERALILMRAVSMRGKQAVPLLDQVEGHRRHCAIEIKNAIRRGECYGP